MDDMELKGSVYRIEKCVLDLLGMEHDFYDDDDDDNDGGWWELMGRDLTLKSTFLYCDLNRVVSCARDDRKKVLMTDLANRLFYFMEELSFAVKRRSISLARARYDDAAVVLQEVMAALTTFSHP